MSDLRVIDVSGYQFGEQPGSPPSINWAAVKASGVEGAYIKITEGTGGYDARAVTNAKAARAAGLKIGLYHFARPDAGTSAAAEAAWFLTHAALVTVDLPHCLDSEKDAANLLAWNTTWFNAVPSGIGYSDRYLRPQLPLPDSRVWIAIPNGTRGGYLGLQYGVGAVPGIVGNVDLDYFDPAFFTTQGDQMTSNQALMMAWCLWSTALGRIPDQPTLQATANLVLADDINALWGLTGSPEGKAYGANGSLAQRLLNLEAAVKTPPSAGKPTVPFTATITPQ